MSSRSFFVKELLDSIPAHSIDSILKESFFDFPGTFPKRKRNYLK